MSYDPKTRRKRLFFVGHTNGSTHISARSSLEAGAVFISMFPGIMMQTIREGHTNV